MTKLILSCFSLILILISSVSAEQCGRQAGGALCPRGRCCSRFGWCGTTDEHCGSGCQSQCDGRDVGTIISRQKFDVMLKHRNEPICPGIGFYSYDAFILAADEYPAFGTTGNTTIRKREVAAFFAQTSYATTGERKIEPDDPYAWGYCLKEEQNPNSSYCTPSSTYPCAPDVQYFGRGPFQLTGNENYGEFGKAVGEDLLNNPEEVAMNPEISFESALWYWMKPQTSTFSLHNITTYQWTPSAADIAAGRLPGFGITTNIINGRIECGNGWDSQGAVRIGFYERFCEILGVDPGPNLDCYEQKPFENGLLDWKNSTGHYSV